MIRAHSSPFEEDIRNNEQILRDLKLQKAVSKRNHLPKDPEVSRKIKVVEVELSFLMIAENIFDHNIEAVKQSWANLYVARTYYPVNSTSGVSASSLKEIETTLNRFRSMRDDSTYPLVFNDPEHSPAIVDLFRVHQKLNDFVDPDDC